MRGSFDDRGANQLDALLDVNSGCFDELVATATIEPVDELQAPQDEIFVAARDRVEAAGVDGGAHRSGVRVRIDSGHAV